MAENFKIVKADPRDPNYMDWMGFLDKNQRRDEYGVELYWFGKYIVRASHSYDDANEPDYLGEFSQERGDDMHVDCAEGLLLGKEYAAKLTLVFDDEQDEDAVFDTADKAFEKTPDAQVTDSYMGRESETDDGKWVYEIQYTAYPILKRDLECYTEDRRNRAFFIPERQGDWSHVSEEDKTKMIAKFGSLEKADQADVAEDYQRFIDWYNNDWTFEVIWVRLYDAKGHELDFSTCGGIESDSDNSYIEETIQDIADEVLGKWRDKVALDALVPDIWIVIETWQDNCNVLSFSNEEKAQETFDRLLAKQNDEPRHQIFMRSGVIDDSEIVEED